MIRPKSLNTLVAFAAALLLAGCGAATNKMLQADSDPHPGVARAHAMPIQGIDISKYQGDIDWTRVPGSTPPSRQMPAHPILRARFQKTFAHH